MTVIVLVLMIFIHVCVSPVWVYLVIYNVLIAIYWLLKAITALYSLFYSVGQQH